MIVTVCAGLGLALASAGFVVANDGPPADIALAAAFSAFLVVGGLLAARRPWHPIAWLLIAEGLVWELGLFCAAAEVGEWILDWIWIPAVVGVPLLLLLFPDGRPPSRRWWPVAWLALAGGAGAAAGLGGALLAPAMLGALASLVVRYRRAGGLERIQLAWFAYAGVLILACSAAAVVLDALGVPETVTSYLNVVPLAALPLATGVALARHRLYDLETLVDRTLLVGLVVLVYLVAIATLGGWSALAAAIVTALAAILLRPRLPHPHRRDPAPLAVKTLGGFRVSRFGEPIGAADWQSKKSRTLFKILIARRGRPVTREQLMENLWPGDDPAKLGNRLSVALATLRGVLGRDLDVIRADADAVSLDLTQVELDVERFFAAVEAGRCEDAERLYTGDFLEEDVYEEWAQDLREQAREAYASAVRTRARDAADDEESVRAYLRLLEHDRWDASAHRELIARLDGAGRHGEAIRRRRTYVRAMAEIGVQAAL